MITRTLTRKVMVNNLQIGGNNDIIIQSMCNIKTSNTTNITNHAAPLNPKKRKSIIKLLYSQNTRKSG